MDAYQIADALNIKTKHQHIDDNDNHNAADLEQDQSNPADPGSSDSENR